MSSSRTPMGLLRSQGPRLPGVETGRGASHATRAKSPHRGVEVHTGDAAASSFKGLVGFQATWGDQRNRCHEITKPRESEEL